MIYSVYFHINKTNNKKYCGFTNDPVRRFRGNGIEYKPDRTENQNRPFWNAICKYSWDEFEHVIVKENLSFEEACELVKHYIKTLRLQEKEFGYNIAEGGNGGRIYQEHPKGMKGKSQTENQINAMRELRKNFNPMEGIRWDVDMPHPRGFKGRKQSEHQKLVASQTHTGKIVTEEIRKKLSEALQGRVFSEETRKKMSDSLKGTRTGVDNPFARKVIVRQNGTNVIYNTVKEVKESLGISSLLFYKLVKSGEEYEAKGNAKFRYAHLNGTSIRYLD
ncbi:GIY-YIG nuclease family protein [Bacillus sp. AFS088145]|uniref:GIY-YIG nuclease family protein n=1 Tax=Bacillus sp. AFS088145 TaxID=2033514 RepID=UPI000BF85A95|nr:GIY-YIG nuclease family protein [Bacillus sp. AFS088145]PFH91389.1 hypothetical protein COI44_01935 [Bacillus sp. AFS088145]